MHVKALLASAVLTYLPMHPAAALPAGNPGLQPLDGISIEAVETYRNPKTQQVDVGLALLPLDPYYNGFAIDLGYRRYFGKTFSWQIANLDYIYSVNKDLTSQLAEKYGVQPKRIERLQLLVSSNVEYVVAYGKFVFRKSYIRYFRSALAAGPAFAISTERSTVGLNLGFRFETFVNEDFSWTLQLRDVYAPSNIDNNLIITLGTTYAF